jgi:hypothetical protein
VQTVAVCVCVCVCVCDFFYTWCLKCSIWFWPLNIRFSVTWLYYFISQVFSLLNLFFFPFPLFFQCFGPRVRRSAGLPVRSAGPPVRPVRSAGPRVRRSGPVRRSGLCPPPPRRFSGDGDPLPRIPVSGSWQNHSVWLARHYRYDYFTHNMEKKGRTWWMRWRQLEDGLDCPRISRIKPVKLFE